MSKGEAFTGAEASSLSVRLSDADTLHGADALAALGLAGADVLGGAEPPAALSLASTDALAGTDAGGLAAADSDAGSAMDAGTAQASLADNDAAAGSDVTAPAGLGDSDAASLTDSGQLEAADADSGAAGEGSALALAAADTAGLSDSGQLEVAGADGGAAGEVSALSVPDGDTGAGLDGGEALVLADADVFAAQLEANYAGIPVADSDTGQVSEVRGVPLQDLAGVTCGVADSADALITATVVQPWLDVFVTPVAYAARGDCDSGAGCDLEGPVPAAV